MEVCIRGVNLHAGDCSDRGGGVGSGVDLGGSLLVRVQVFSLAYEHHEAIKDSPAVYC